MKHLNRLVEFVRLILRRERLSDDPAVPLPGRLKGKRFFGWLLAAENLPPGDPELDEAQGHGPLQGLFSTDNLPVDQPESGAVEVEGGFFADLVSWERLDTEEVPASGLRSGPGLLRSTFSQDRLSREEIPEQDRLNFKDIFAYITRWEKL
ncbi:hypothetical protein ACFLT7_03850 [candidate division KSB1 bacterium]